MLLLVLIACTSTETTPLGPLGASGPLPRPTPAALTGEITEHRVQAEVCAWPEVDQPASMLDIRWRAQAEGSGRYLLDYSVELAGASPGVEVALLPDAGLPALASLDPGAPEVGVATVAVRCRREGGGGCRSVSYDATDFVQIRADGKLH